jgi:hypothetical protein
MSGNDVERAIVEVLTEIQSMSGADCPTMDGRTCPLRDLPQFDSQLALLATVELSARLQCEIPEDVNVFVDDETNRPRRIGEIRDQICAMLEPRRTAHER